MKTIAMLLLVAGVALAKPPTISYTLTAPNGQEKTFPVSMSADTPVRMNTENWKCEISKPVLDDGVWTAGIACILVGITPQIVSAPIVCMNNRGVVYLAVGSREEKWLIGLRCKP